MSVNQVDKQTGNTSLVAGGTLYADAPIGAILAFGGSSAPAGWLLCQGQAISRTTYAALFAVIGTAFGAGDGSTTFNVPDLRESTIKGAGLTGLSNNHIDTDGLTVGEFIDDRLQFHSHNTYLTGVQISTGGLWATAHDYSSQGTHTSNPEAPARSGNTTEVKAIGANFIIKAQQVALPADFATELDKKQNITDNTLETTSKTVPGAINEIHSALADVPEVTNGSDTLSKIYVHTFEIPANSAYTNLPLPTGKFSAPPMVFATMATAGGFTVAITNESTTQFTAYVRLNDTVPTVATSIKIMAVGN